MSQPTPTHPPTRPLPSHLHYDVVWMERTFRSRATTESLLRPQLESGNLTSQDYDAAVSFLPGFHRHYRTAGVFAGTGLAFKFRRPQWTNGRIGLFVLFGAIMGNTIGVLADFKAHLSFVRSIQDPAGFSQAMDTIQKQIGGPIGRGPTIPRPFEELQSSGEQPNQERMNREQESFASSTNPPVSKPSTMPEPVASPAAASTSKWDQIRATNARKAGSSSWDNLRQQHERTTIPRSPGGGSGSDSVAASANNDRAAEQAEFDALLEKERNITS
ncbi:hypothetical protein BDQ12DRAFT_678831 [Crucibulum laeve]|uniref:Uncharacterized protein n=1 Tax=Crucibulum laeve TaxID=68775 RepID=A0A5C3M9E3_9AGAR|nr:hypothetical protein BDQ12DRAFT_678831 [Crucibulum laeve]